MLTVIIIMTLGILAGFLLRKHRVLFRFLDRSISYVIYLLLFLLGVSVGGNEMILRNFHLIGLKALLITAASVAGSLIAAALVYRVFFQKRGAAAAAESEILPEADA